MSLFCFPLSVKGIVTTVTWNCEQTFSLYTFLTTESYELVCIYWNTHYLFFLNKGFFLNLPRWIWYSAKYEKYYHRKIRYSHLQKDANILTTNTQSHTYHFPEVNTIMTKVQVKNNNSIHKLTWRYRWRKTRKLWGWDPWWECWDSHGRAIQMRGERHSYCSGLKKKIMTNHFIWKLCNLICLVCWPSFLEYLQNSKVFLPKGVGKDPLFSVCPLRIFKT